MLRRIKTLWHEILNGFCGLLSEFLYLNKLFRVISRIYFIKLDFIIKFTVHNHLRRLRILKLFFGPFLIMKLQFYSIYTDIHKNIYKKLLLNTLLSIY
jgi:hypothetical protein